MKKCFNWVNLLHMYSNKNISKGSKFDNRLYLMQEIKEKDSLKLNEEGLNEDLH